MQLVGDFGLRQLFRAFRFRICTTWALVLLENTFLALIPLLIGLAIDGLLDGSTQKLFLLAGVFALLTVLAVVRRIYDTRAYGTIRVALGSELDQRHSPLPVSTRNARLDMARELVDFLEQEVPDILTAVVQLSISLIVLSLFDTRLAISALIVTVGMIVLYAFFHRRFFTLNAALNGQKEQQVRVLERGGAGRLVQHLKALRSGEVRLSDTEAVLYGLIFLMMAGFVIYNLWISALLPAITAGKIFSIVSYSWEYVEAAVMLPVALQSWSRLHEITVRINNGKTGSASGNENTLLKSDNQ